MISNSDREFKIKNKGLPYGYGSLNNRPALHRILLGIELNNRNLLDKIVYVQNNTQVLSGRNDQYQSGKIDPLFVQDIDFLVQQTGFEKFEKLLPIKWNNELIKNCHHVYL